MAPRIWFAVALIGLSASVAVGESWDTWPPRGYLLESLVRAVPALLDRFHPETGKFGTEPWICQDQNLVFPLAAAWAIEDPANPWHHSDQVLEAIAKGGETLVDEMDETGKWVFRKKDNSTWGPIHMPWTYSRWIRAYALVRDALPKASREKWERGLVLGFTGIREYAGGGVHNIPAHHAMALYVAGDCFGNEEWKEAAAAFMARVVDEQDAGGYWSEHFGPVVGYNKVYMDALGTYYHFSKDPIVLEALKRSARFHSSVLWPDGSSVSCIDERQVYHAGVDAGNVGFSWTPEGRGYLLKQVPASSDNGAKHVGADYAASMLLYGGSGESVVPASSGDEGTVLLGDNDAIIRRRKPWQWAFSGYACAPPDSRWIQDRQNLVDVYHDDLGLVVGGGNTKMQPYWSTFTVGDPVLLKHVAGDESPDFTPEIDLLWTPDAAALSSEGASTTMELRYGGTDCRVEATITDDASLVLTYRAPAGQGVEGHVPLLHRGKALQTAGGEMVLLEEEEIVLDAGAVGGHIVYGKLKVTVPAGALLRWPARQHNPYKKDGGSSLRTAKLVLVLPFEEKDTYEVTFSYESGTSSSGSSPEAVRIFDGKGFDGWEGNLEWFRVEDGAIVAGSLDKPIPHNEFLCTTTSYGDFELRLKVKLAGRNANAGIQIRSRRIPDHHEVSGYQADMGQNYWGALYDESRRNRVLASPDPEALSDALDPDGWNDYVIRCVGNRVQLWLNGHQTVDYTEPDSSIEQTGIVGLQIHGGAPSEAWYKDITIKRLP